MRCTKCVFQAVGVVTVCLSLMSGPARAESIGLADFENLSLPSESHWNGTDTTYNSFGGDYNSFQTGGAALNNYHEYYYSSYFGCDMDYWEGWGYSNQSDIASVGPLGEFAAVGSGISGHNGAGGSANYGVAFVAWTITPTVTFDQPVQVGSAAFTNNAWAYSSMSAGDGFAKKFGGSSGDDADWFKLTITGKDAGGAAIGTVDFYLADFRSADNAQDYIIDQWTTVDLSSLGTVKSLEFGLSSSDVGGFGMNTPSYFAMDNLTFSATPEPSTLVLLCTTGAAWAVILWRRRSRRG